MFITKKIVSFQDFLSNGTIFENFNEGHFQNFEKVVRLNSSISPHFQKNKAKIKNATQIMPNHIVSSSLNDWMCLKTTLTLRNLLLKSR